MGAKIIIVANTSWSILNFRKGLLVKLLGLGCELTIVAPRDSFSQLLEGLGCKFMDLPVSARGVNPLGDILFCYRLYCIYKAINPNFIIHYTIKPNIYGSFAAKLASKPSLAITTGLGYVFSKKSILRAIVKMLYKYSLCFASEVWFLNGDDKELFLESRLVSNKKAVLIDGEGVDLSYFRPIKNCASDGRVRFLLIARMLWDKGVGEFVEAARIIKREYPDAIFQLLGASDVENPASIGRSVIDKWVSEGVVEYLGVTSDVRPFIAMCDCVVLPSYYREGVPRALMEAAAMSKPLITTNNVGCRELVEHEVTGYLCSIKDALSLAQCFKLFINLPEKERLEMGSNGRKLMSQKFDEEIIIAKYLDVLHRLNVIA